MGTHGVIARLIDAEVPQGLPEATVIFPAPEPGTTSILFVPCPEDIDHPAGTVQLYDEAPVTDAVL